MNIGICGVMTESPDGAGREHSEEKAGARKAGSSDSLAGGNHIPGQDTGCSLASGRCSENTAAAVSSQGVWRGL